MTPGQTLDKVRHVLSRQPPFEWTIATDLAVWLVVGFGVLVLAERLIWLLTTRVTVLKHAVEHHTGLARRYTTRIQFRDVESLSLYRSWLGVLLDYGTVTIHGRGSTRIVLANVATARDLMLHIDQQVARADTQARPAPANIRQHPDTAAIEEDVSLAG